MHKHTITFITGMMLVGQFAGDAQVAVPSAMAQIPMPSGNQFTIESKEITVGRQGSIRIRLSCSKPHGRGKQARPDGLAVVYSAQATGGRAGAPDGSQLASIVAIWQRSLALDAQLAKSRGIIARTGDLESAGGGVTQFNISLSADGTEAIATGTLKPGLAKVSPKFLGVVATSGSVPVSNFIWIPLTLNLGPESTSRFSVDSVAPYESPSRPAVDVPAPNPAAQLLSGSGGRPAVASHRMGVNGVAFSPDGTLLASWSTDDNTVKLWNLPSGRLQTTLSESSAEAAAFSPDGSLLFTGGYAKAVTVRTLPGAEFKARLMGFAGNLVGVTHLLMSRNGSLVVSEGRGEAFALFTLPDMKWRGTLDSDGEAAFGTTLSPDGKFLIASRFDQTIRIWTLPEGRLVNTIADYSQQLAISPDGTLLAYGRKGLITLCTVPGGQVQAQLRVQGEDRLGIRNAVAFSPDGRRLAASNGAKRIEIFAAPDWKSESVFVDDSCNLGAEALAFSPDGKMLASAGDSGLVTLWELGGEGRRWGLVDPSLVRK
jgi:WD40 repeat protein